MNRVITILSMVLLLSNCTTIPKYELPTSGTPPKVAYKKELSAVQDKKVNYDSVMTKFKEVCPDSKVIIDDKYNCYFQMVGYSIYKYQGKDHKFSFALNFQGDNQSCSILINRIKILHYDLEHMYLDDKRKTVRSFNSTYEQINVKINFILDELVKQVK